MSNLHNLFIISLIVIIVVIQLLVFLSVFRRIKLFKGIFPDTYHFKTVTVCVPADRIADITPDELLGKHTNNPDDEYAEIVEVTDDVIVEVADDENEEQLDDLDEGEVWVEDGSDEIWMRNGNEEQKVPVRLVRQYSAKGWTRIIPANTDEDDDLPF